MLLKSVSQACQNITCLFSLCLSMFKDNWTGLVETLHVWVGGWVGGTNANSTAIVCPPAKEGGSGTWHQNFTFDELGLSWKVSGNCCQKGMIYLKK